MNPRGGSELIASADIWGQLRAGRTLGGCSRDTESGLLIASVGSQGSNDQRDLSLHLRFAGGADEPCELFTEAGSDGTPRYTIEYSPGVVTLQLWTSYSDSPLSLKAHLTQATAASEHEVLVRFSGHHLELYVDGFLSDEEWPVGPLAGGTRKSLGICQACPTKIVPDVHSFALWDRLLSDFEFGELLGGSRPAPDDPVTSPQYREAPGGGFVGDCMPFYFDGRFHFFYLFDRHNHRSKYGLGAHQWAHMSSSDLVHWETHPTAVAITDEREGSICTGSLFVHESTWYAFYATRMLDRSEHLSLATSNDGIHFTKLEPNPFASPAPPYRSGPFRDPFVFQDPTDGVFHMIVTAEVAEPAAAGRGGCLAHLESKDLKTWNQLPPFFVSGYGDQPECSELFRWRDWYYLVFSHFGSAHYRMAKSLYGPWIRPSVDRLDGPQARVMKSTPFGDGRRIGAAFLDKGQGYAGAAIFREYLQEPDGTLSTTWPIEMVPDCAAPIRVSGIFSGHQQAVSTTGLVLGSASYRGISVAAIPDIPHNVLLRFTATPAPGVSSYGIGVRGKRDFSSALLLVCEPGRRKVGWRPADAADWCEYEGSSIYEVRGLEGTTTVDVLLLDDIMDVCINQRRTLISRNDHREGDWLFFYCQDSTVSISEIEIRPMLENALSVQAHGRYRPPYSHQT